ncbi:MAG: nucleotide exchange factor GrpE [Hyphomicrobiaceae bacterium]
MSDQNRSHQPGQGNGAGNEAKKAAGPERTDQAPKPSEARSSEPKASKKEEAEAAADMDTHADAVDIGADPSAVLAAEVETLQAQIADLTDRLLRAHADLDNIRKRGEREKQETARYAISNFAKDTVSLVDNFQRAMQAVEPAAIEKDPHLKALLEGVAMTEREFMNVLERHGVRRITPKGQPFDPRLHQAVMERQDPSVANGTVVEVFQSGYTIEDRCLRPAMVVVARGGGKAQPAEKTAAEENSASASAQTPEERNQQGGDQTAQTADAAPDSDTPSSDNDNPTA